MLTKRSKSATVKVVTAPMIRKISQKGFTFTRKEPNGFTLVEILVAISIMALLVAVGVPNLRHFNDTQLLQNTTNDLVRVLREAQSSASSKVACDSTHASTSWQVSISSTGYQESSLCYNPQAALPTPTPFAIARYSPNPESVTAITWAITAYPSGTSCGSAATVQFTSQFAPFDVNRFSNINFGSCGVATDSRLQIHLSYNSQDSYVCVDKGGAIYGTPTACT